jgi:hypothetical protein
MKNERRSRPHPRKVRFNDAENEYINQKIKESPFKDFQNFARILLINGEINITDYSELRTLNFEVNKIGNNINQMAKLAHQFEEISSADIEELKVMISELSQKIGEKVKLEQTKDGGL